MLVCLVQIISHLDSQSKFQMFTLLYDRHIGGVTRSSNMAAPSQALKICSEHINEYLNFRAAHTA